MPKNAGDLSLTEEKRRGKNKTAGGQLRRRGQRTTRSQMHRFRKPNLPPLEGEEPRPDRTSRGLREEDLTAEDILQACEQDGLWRTLWGMRPPERNKLLTVVCGSTCLFVLYFFLFFFWIFPWSPFRTWALGLQSVRILGLSWFHNFWMLWFLSLRFQVEGF